MVTDTLDQAVHIEIDPDSMTATALINRPHPHTPPDEPTIRAAVSGAGVLLTREVSAAISRAVAEASGPGDWPRRIVIARGVPPRAGTPGRFDLDPALTAGGAHTPSYRIVRAGDALGVLVPPTPGEDGRDVRGRTLPAPEVLPYPLQCDDSVLIDTSGVARAMRTGLLALDLPRLAVRDELHLPGPVDLSTGHIDFPGRVTIDAGVRDTFEVRATGLLTIHGLIEAARIIGAADVVLSGGMAARGTGELAAGRDARVKYLDSVRGIVGRHLHVQKEIVNCFLGVGGALHASDASLIGGELAVGGAIALDTLGSESGVATILRAGWIERLEAIAQDIGMLLPVLETRLSRAQEALDQVKNVKGRHTASQAETLTEREFDAAAAREAVQRATTALDAVRRCAASRTVVQVTIRSRVFPGSVIIAGRSEIRFVQELAGPVRVRLDPAAAVRVILPGEDESSPPRKQPGLRIHPIGRHAFSPTHANPI